MSTITKLPTVLVASLVKLKFVNRLDGNQNDCCQLRNRIACTKNSGTTLNVLFMFAASRRILNHLMTGEEKIVTNEVTKAIVDQNSTR